MAKLTLTLTLSAMLLVLGACSSKHHTSSDSDDPFTRGGSGADSDGGLFGNPDQGGKSGSSSSGSGADNDSSAGSGGSSATPLIDGGIPGATAMDPLALCGGACQCSDGIDNDGDGTIDGFDSECTGASDDDEGTFATGIPGDNRDPKWQDCFFDGNSGAGDDGCRYSSDCLTGDLPQDDPKCTVTQHCVDFCKPRTPNGCDCFGCCSFTLEDGSTKNVMLDPSCQEGTWEGCTECIPAAECVNECGRCELCRGKTIADLPADCATTPPPPTGGAGGSSGDSGSGGASGNSGSGGTDGSAGSAPPPPGYTCDGGEKVCTMTTDCPNLNYCSFGCCQPIVL